MYSLPAQNLLYHETRLCNCAGYICLWLLKHSGQIQKYFDYIQTPNMDDRCAEGCALEATNLSQVKRSH